MADEPNALLRALEYVSPYYADQARNSWNRLANVGAGGLLPPEVRERGKNALLLAGELSPGAGVRDFLGASGQFTNSMLGADPAAALGGLGGMALGAAGVVPGGRSAGLPVKPARENLRNLIDANFDYGRFVGHKTVPIESLTGTISAAADDARHASALAEKMKSPQGYIERLIVDGMGNVIEGQHRLVALRKLGVDKVPVTVIEDMGRLYDVEGMKAALLKMGGLHPDQARGMVNEAVDVLRQYGTPERALAETSMPDKWQPYYETALRSAAKRKE